LPWNVALQGELADKKARLEIASAGAAELDAIKASHGATLAQLKEKHREELYMLQATPPPPPPRPQPLDLFGKLSTLSFRGAVLISPPLLLSGEEFCQGPTHRRCGPTSNQSSTALYCSPYAHTLNLTTLLPK